MWNRGRAREGLGLTGQITLLSDLEISATKSSLCQFTAFCELWVLVLYVLTPAFYQCKLLPPVKFVVIFCVVRSESDRMCQHDQGFIYTLFRAVLLPKDYTAIAVLCNVFSFQALTVCFGGFF